ncbi:MAG: hypothetical protein K8S56_07325, partial [Candidatus Cloacimonetes bacterium]|nr:hypothetical protein [Candidatus Cloacimonadota bacterium]
MQFRPTQKKSKGAIMKQCIIVIALVALSAIMLADGPPRDFLVTHQAENNILMEWLLPVEANQLYWDTGVSSTNIGYGPTSPIDAIVAARFEPADLQAVDGLYVSAMSIFPGVDTNATYWLKIWTGGSATNPGTEVLNQQFDASTITSDDFNIINLTTAVLIDATQELWIGYRCNATVGGYPFGLDDANATTTVTGKGNLICSNGNTWDPLNSVSTYQGNWLLRGLLSATPTGVATRYLTSEEQPFSNYEVLPFTSFAPTNTPVYNNLTRDLLGYNVYRDGTLITSTDDITWRWAYDTVIPVGNYQYWATAVYDSGESIPSDTIDVNITYDPPVNAPRGLSGEVQEYNEVLLLWSSPGPVLGSEDLHWDTEEYIGNTVGTDSDSDYLVAQRFEPADLMAYNGQILSQVSFIPTEERCFYTIRIYQGGSVDLTDPLNPVIDEGTLIHEQFVFDPFLSAPNIVDLNAQVIIDATQEMWIALYLDAETGYPVGCSGDGGDYVSYKGNLMYLNGEWFSCEVEYPELDYNWYLHGFVMPTVVYQPAASLPENRMPLTRNTRLVQSTCAMNGNPASAPTRNLTGFKVYRDGVEVSDIADPTMMGYIDDSLAAGSYSYSVSAVFTQGESGQSIPEVVDVELPTPTNLTATQLPGIPNVYLIWETPTTGGGGTTPPIRELMNYKVYRDDVYIGETMNTNYIDNGVPDGEKVYYVTAFYTGDHESLPSNLASAGGTPVNDNDLPIYQTVL